LFTLLARIKQMGAKVRRRLEEEEDQLYGL
jgi:hypothetical protein